VTAADVLGRGKELRQQGIDDGGGLWAMAEYVDWLFAHGEALMRVAKLALKIRDHNIVGFSVHPCHPLATDLDAACDALRESKPAPRVP
jgi:hypothetical protein